MSAHVYISVLIVRQCLLSYLDIYVKSLWPGNSNLRTQHFLGAGPKPTDFWAAILKHKVNEVKKLFQALYPSTGHFTLGAAFNFKLVIIDLTV